MNEWQSAINTLRTWRIRRLTKGKVCERAELLRRVAELWPDIDAANAEKIADGVLNSKPA